VYDEDRLSDVASVWRRRRRLGPAGTDHTVEVDDKDPKRAADLAKRVRGRIEENSPRFLRSQKASQRRLFFEQQLLQAKDNLTAAEIAARQGLQKGGIAQVDAQGRSMIEVTARLRAQVSVKEVQLGAMRAFATEGNPEVQRNPAGARVAQARAGAHRRFAPTGPAGKADSAGGTGLDNLGRLRNVKYYEFLYEMLAKQYELAKIDEARTLWLYRLSMSLFRLTGSQSL